jgi:hypothetical protein
MTTRNCDIPGWYEAQREFCRPEAQQVFDATLAVTGDPAAAYDAMIKTARDLYVAEKGHDCEANAEDFDVEAPCPACPDGIWRAVDYICSVCGDVLQASGHVHGPWSARAHQVAMDYPEAYEQMIDSLEVDS